MELSQSYNIGCEFSRLIRFDSGQFFCLLSMRLFQFYNPGYEFNMSIHVNFSCYFLSIFFKRLTQVDLINCCFNIIFLKKYFEFLYVLTNFLDCIWIYKMNQFNFHIIFTRKIIAIPEYLFLYIKKKSIQPITYT
jgi:hypothetical protein